MPSGGVTASQVPRNSPAKRVRRTAGKQAKKPRPNDYQSEVPLSADTTTVPATNQRFLDQQARILKLESQVTVLRNEKRELSQCIRAAEMNQSDPTGKAMAKLELQNTILARKLNDVRALYRGLDLLKTDSLGISEEGARLEVDYLAAEIGKAASSLRNCANPLCSFHEIESAGTAELDRLVSRICGLTLEQLRIHASEKQIPKENILRAIAGAAICESFESNHLDFLGMESPLLDIYREILFRMGQGMPLIL